MPTPARTLASPGPPVGTGAGARQCPCGLRGARGGAGGGARRARREATAHRAGRRRRTRSGARRARRGSALQTSVCGARPAARTLALRRPRRHPPCAGPGSMGQDRSSEPVGAQSTRRRRRDLRAGRPRHAGAADSARLAGAPARGRRAISGAQAVAEPAPDRITSWFPHPPLGGVAGAASGLPVSIALSWGGSAAGRKGLDKPEPQRRSGSREAGAGPPPRVPSRGAALEGRRAGAQARPAGRGQRGRASSRARAGARPTRGRPEQPPAPRGGPEPRHAGWTRARTAAAGCGRAPSLGGDRAMTAGRPKGLTWVSSAKLSPSREPV